MDKKYIVDQLKILAERYDLEVSDDLLGTIVSKASFRVIPAASAIYLSSLISFAITSFSNPEDTYSLRYPSVTLPIQEGILRHIPVQNRLLHLF